MAVTLAKFMVTLVIVTSTEAAAVSLHQKNKNNIAFTRIMNKNKKGLGYSRFATVVPERLNTTYEKPSFEYFQCISMVTDLHNTRQKVNYMLQHPILIDISH